MHGRTLKDAMSRLSTVLFMYSETQRHAMALIQNHPDHHERVFIEIDLPNATRNSGWRSATGLVKLHSLWHFVLDATFGIARTEF